VEAAAAGLNALADAARRGDADAFRVLYQDMQPRLLRYLRALAGDDAEDVASETWLQVARDVGTFTGDYDGFRGWVTTIARHRALDLVRYRSRRPATVPVSADDLASLPAAEDTAAGGIEAVTTNAAVRLIATLPPDQAEAVLLRAVVGLDVAMAARVLGKREGAVRSAAHRGLRALAKRLTEQSSAASAEPGGTPPVKPGGTPSVKPGGTAVTQTRTLALKEVR
jgi:RNA polymerase sigma-70 factor, ECF subfamily